MQNFWVAVSIGVFALFGVGCDSEPDTAGEAIEDAGENLGDAVDDAGDEMEDAAEEVEERMEN